ncbi:MAG: hypothetical protein HVN35_10885 [Methanobacteriaceae archaeon]|nr:hypothetical protein [Methanobacteriaceae archaeon]
MKKIIVLSFLLIILTIASSGCNNLDNNQNTTTELNRTGSGTGSGSGSTGSDGGSGEKSEGDLIDSGKTTGPEGTLGGGNFTYVWKTYKVNSNKLIIYSTYYEANGYTVEQTNTLEKSPTNPEMLNVVTVVPKVTGRDSWQHVTGNWDYENLIDYYWNVFRPNWLMDGPIH